MLDSVAVKEFLDNQFEDLQIVIPKDINEDVLVSTFCQYVEDDYYEWLKDNFKSFFDHGNPDWVRIKKRIKYYSKH
jgi:hypothetical protein